MNQTSMYSVPGIHCNNCRERIESKVSAVPGVGSAQVDIDANQVTVRGDGYADDAIRAAIKEAGYEAE